MLTQEELTSLYNDPHTSPTVRRMIVDRWRLEAVLATARHRVRSLQNANLDERLTVTLHDLLNELSIGPVDDEHT